MTFGKGKSLEVCTVVFKRHFRPPLPAAPYIRTRPTTMQGSYTKVRGPFTSVTAVIGGACDRRPSGAHFFDKVVFKRSVWAQKRVGTRASLRLARNTGRQARVSGDT